MLCMVVGASSAWAQSDYSATYTSNVKLSAAGGTNASDCKVVINETQYDGIKIGTGSAVGAMKIAIPEGTKYLHMHISGWNGVTGLSLNVTGMDPAPASLSVTADAGVHDSSPFTLQEDPSTNDFYKVITFSSPLENETTLTFTTSGKKRCVIYGVNAEDDSASSDTRTATTVTIDASGITNTNIYTSTDAGSLSATVKAGEAAVTGASVTWESDDDNVAKVDASTGAVTLVGAGTVNITAAYAGDETNYKPSSATYELTVTNSPTHTATFSVNGNTSTADFQEDADITFPADPADIGEKTFVGWTESAISGTTDTEPTLVTSATMGNADITFYAVFATASGGATTVTDELTRATTGVASGSTNYTPWSDKTATSDAVYAGNSAGGNDAIQLRTKNSNEGVVTTASGGTLKKITIEWNSKTSAGRKVDIYANDAAYSAASDLYNSSTQGTKIGTLAYDTETELSVPDGYTYFGLRSNDGALYLDKISVQWQAGSVSYSGYCTTVEADTRADADLSFSSATASATIGQDFTAPTLSAATGFNGTVEYESSDESVAQIMDQETGEIRLVGEGTATITATFAGNDDFKAGSASYTLTVTDNRIATTITYDNITLDVTEVATLTQLSPVVKDADNNIIEYTYEEFPPTVSFSLESDENGIIGSLDNNSGEITLNATEGTVTLKAYYNLYGVSDTYKPSQCTFTITVEDMNAPGKVNNPYTVAEALAADPANGVYVQGTISAITEVSTQYKNATYTISDGTNEMLIYRGRYLDNADFTSEDQIAVGDIVTVYGNLQTSSNVNRMASGNYIVSQTQKELSSITLSGDYTTSFVEGSEFNYEGVVVTATYSDQTTADVTELATFTEPDMTQVGDQDVTVSYGNQTASYTITITALPTHTATFSVNGTTSTENFKEGAAIDFPVVADQIGMKCVGWVTSEISGTTDVKPSLVTSATMGSEDITYYAVFAFVDDSGETTYEKLESDEFEAGATYLLAGPQSASVATLWYLSSYSAVDTNLGWGEASTALADAKTFTLSGTAGELYAQDNDGNYLKFGGTSKFTMSSTATAIELDEAGNIRSGENFLRHNYNNGGGGFRWYNKETSQPANFYKVISGTTYSDYCTTIPTTVAITITAARAASFSTTFPLDFTGVEGITAYAATLKTDKYVHLEAVTTVPAGEGIIVKGAQGTYNVPVATGEVTLDCSEENLLKGTATEAKVISTDEAATERFYKYVKTESGKVGFQKVLSTASEEKRTCAKGRAYLELTDEQQARFIGFADEEGGIATGINAIDNGQLTMDNDVPAYNLAGQKVGKGYKGIVIQNGKKYVK